MVDGCPSVGSIGLMGLMGLIGLIGLMGLIGLIVFSFLNKASTSSFALWATADKDFFATDAADFILTTDFFDTDNTDDLAV